MAEIIWTELSLNQLKRAIKYIQAERGKFYATLVFTKIINLVDTLEEFPTIGTKEPLLRHKKSEYRFLVAWHYKIIYRVAKDKVVISRVFHTSQKPTKIFKK